MSLEKLLGIVVVCITFILSLTILVNAVILYNVKSNIISFEQVILVYSKNNGGFNDSDSMYFNDFLNKNIKDFNLKDKVENINLSHTINTKVEKGEEISISLNPRYKIIIPFTEYEYEVIGKEVKRSTVVVKYSK